MACTCGCDSSCGCDCCGKPGGGAGRPEVEELRAKVAQLEAELAWTAMAMGSGLPPADAQGGLVTRNYPAGAGFPGAEVR